MKTETMRDNRIEMNSDVGCSLFIVSIFTSAIISSLYPHYITLWNELLQLIVLERIERHEDNEI